MFREGQIAVIRNEQSPNYGFPMQIVKATGWNFITDEVNHPDFREAKLLQGPMAGQAGSVRVSDLAVYLNG